MIIYEATKTEFISDVPNELLVERHYESYQKKIGREATGRFSCFLIFL
ncbi:hypothetical protein ACTSEZ_14495 [Metabacillus sp. JX24]